MGRRTLVSRARHQFWLAHKIASQQPLVVRTGKHRRLAHESGFVSTTAETAGRAIVLREQGFKQPEGRDQVIPRPRFIDLSAEMAAGMTEAIEDDPEAINRGRGTTGSLPFYAHDEDLAATTTRMDGDPEAINRGRSTTGFLPFYRHDGNLAAPQHSTHLQEQPVVQTTDASTFELETPQVSHEEIDQLPTTIDQSPIIKESVDAQSQQEHTDTSAQPVENIKAKRQRGHIQEQPAGTQHTPPAPNGEQKIPPKDVGVQTERKNQPRRAADDLFVPQDIDRSPQAWMARLMGTKNTDHDDAIPPEMQPATLPEEPTETENVQGREAIYYSVSPRVHPMEETKIVQGREAIYYSGHANERGDDIRMRPVGGTGIVQGREAIYYSGHADYYSGHADERGDGTPGIINGTHGIINGFPTLIEQSEREGDAPTPFPTQTNNSQQTESNQFANMNSTPLSQNTIRFLQPLVGIDPANIRVHRDALAERLTDHYQADAITIGDDVEVAAGHQEDTPETLGLLAHEFTHVARKQEPRFIPPIARSVRSPLSLPGQTSVADEEEALAQKVEGRVKRIAQEQIDQVGPALIEPPDITATLESGTSDPVPAAASRSQRDTWGGLPAPWEPLPDWMVPSLTSNVQAPTIPQMNAGGNGIQRTSQAYGNNGGIDARPTSMPDNSGVQRAGQERSSSEEDSQSAISTPPHPPDTVKAPEPDLDALARQVYTLLKRRLEVEYRREE